MGNLQRELLDRRHDAPASDAAPRVPDTGVRSEAFTYRADPSRTQSNLRNFLARTPDPAARADLARLFAAQPSIIEDIGAALRPYGIDPLNAADAYAVWWINAWSTSQSLNREPDRGTVAAVKQQVYAAFATSADFPQTDDAARQEYAEALMLQAFLLSAAFEQVGGDPVKLEQLARAARQGAMANGIDLERITLTPDGFVLRKGR